MMHSLESVKEHRTVLLEEDVPPNLDEVVGPDPDEVLVIRSVVQLAERQPVGHYRIPSRIGIGDYVCRIEEWFMPQTAEGTLRPVGAQHTFPEGLLVEPPSECRRDVRSPPLDGL